VKLQSLRKAASFLALGLAFGSMAHTGELPLFVLPLWGAVWVAALLTDGSLAQRLGSAITWLTVAALAGALAGWLSGAFDLVVAAGLFACAVSANRLLSRRTAADDAPLYLTALMMVAAGAALSGSIAYGAYFAGFAVTATFALTLSHLERVATEYDAPPSAVRRLVSAPLLLAVGALSVFALLGSIVVFFGFPRFTTGFLAPMLGHRSPTVGYSDSMRLDGIGTVKDDPRVVAHLAVSPDPLVEGLEMHWRGRAFERFDGRAWLGSGKELLPQRQLTLAPASDRAMRQVEVEILPEGGSPAVFLPEGTAGVSEPRRIPPRRLAPTLFFFADELGNVRLQPAPDMGYGYHLVAQEPRRELARLGTDYPEDIRRRCLEPIAGLDPRIADLARRWTSGLTDPLDKAQAIERELSKGYAYTLELPGETADPIANFLFERRKGHCEFFASALTLLLRSVDVPARNASGYFGGQRVGEGQYVLRAGDAHAWTEVYFPGAGFVAFDPTPAQARLSSASGWRQKWADLVDKAQAGWLQKVIDYSIRDQVEGVSGLAQAVGGMLTRLHGGGGLPWKRILSAAGVLALAIWVARRLWEGGRPARARMDRRLSAEARDAVKLYRALLARLKKRGIQKRPGQTPRELVAELRSKRRPETAVAEEVTERYLAARFGGRPLGPAEQSRLRRAVREL
jgi:transglutaminase-like putative cysteine protease